MDLHLRGKNVLGRELIIFQGVRFGDAVPECVAKPGCFVRLDRI